MSQIEELQHRIMAAMERIGTGVEALRRVTPGDGSQGDGLQVALDDERLANAQLQERLKSLKDRHQQEIDAMRADVEHLRAAPADASETEALREQLAEATAKLASVEAARADLAEAKAALDNTEELDALKSENGKLRGDLEQVRTLLEQAQQIEAENSRLKSELADTERVGDLTTELDMLRAERASHGAAMSRLDDDLQRMRKANEELRHSIDELRSAAEEGMTDAELLNRATVAELEATRAAQATDAAEAQAVLARLEPLLSQAKLAEGEVE